MPAVLAASTLSLLAWVYLLLCRGGYWRTDQRLPPGPDPGGRWPSVVAVVPARDEAAVLPQTLPTLLGQSYPGPFGVVLVDDESTDGTADVAAGLGAKVPPGEAGSRLTVVPGSPPPDGWAGKVWAMAQGLQAAGDAEYVLFTDADIGYAPGTVTALTAAAQGGRLALVSQMALLRAETPAERLLIPAFVYFFAQLYPFRLVNRSGSRTAAAAGGCMLVLRQALVQAGGLEQIRGARIDDVALGRLLKRSGQGCWLGFSTDVVSRRRYEGLAEIWDMVARSAYTQLAYSPLALAGTVLGMALLYLLPVAAALAGLVLLAGGTALSTVPAWQAGWLAAAGVGTWAIMAASYVPVLRLCRVPAIRAAALPLIGVLYTGMTISSARRHHAGRGGEWKGRTVSRPGGSRDRRRAAGATRG